MDNIKVGDFVKVIKRRNYDFMDCAYKQVFKVYEIEETPEGTCANLQADDYLISLDYYFNYSDKVGFMLDELEKVEEKDILQGRIDNLNYRISDKQDVINDVQLEIDSMAGDVKALLDVGNVEFVRNESKNTFLEFLKESL